jgi:hypothetical protein
LDEPIDLPPPPKSTTSHSKAPKASSSSLTERNQRIDCVIDEVIQFVNQMHDISAPINSQAKGRFLWVLKIILNVLAGNLNHLKPFMGL